MPELLEPLSLVRPPQSEGSQLVRNFVQLLLEFGLGPLLLEFGQEVVEFGQASEFWEFLVVRQIYLEYSMLLK